MLHIAMCLFAMLCIARGKILELPKDTEAVVGENVTLKYRTDVNDTSRSMEWRYQKVPGPTFEFVYKRNLIFGKFRDRFYVDPNTTTGQHDLLVSDVQLDDAGRYTGSNSNRNAELIVFDRYPSSEFCTITSTSNDNQNGCESESLTISCDLSYRGNRNLTLEWLEGDNIIPSTLKNNSDGSITSSIQLQKSQLKTAKFTCRVLYSADSARTSRFTWSPTVNITPMETMSDLSYGGCDHQTVECSDGKSPHCQYTWKDENGTEVSSSSSMQMTGKPNGNYTCLAACKVKVHQASCSHVAKIFIYRCDDSNSQSTSATSSPETVAPPESIISLQGMTSQGMYIGIPVASVILIAAIILIVALLFRRSLTCNGTAHGNHAINDAEICRTGCNNHIEMRPLNGTISQGPTENDVMLTDTH